ncbi:TIGR04255 family protein [Atlantibacter subterranea]|uniref:TIGR04255 family protein n=1 Tax=Atlantibacter subterraneus TaxID=255519 RepID=A0ABU4E8S7_9ENTR|nr:TIGR04255 family protein [Atlantibacter subterranea]MDV7025544.1 TIGR04255 family protein [Atlantibacter subterranea]MDZ5668735.1 TIGR04255 family protein [Atlantibacter hermannii]
MNENLIYMLSKIQYGRIPTSKFHAMADNLLDRLRKDYPFVFPKKNVQTFKFELKPSGMPEMSQEDDPVLTLGSAKKDWVVRITPEYVILQTKNYGGFTNFHSRIEKVMTATTSILEVSHFSFIGMRFINKFPHLDYLENEFELKRADFLQPNLCGMDKGGCNMSARYEDVNKKWSVNVNSGVIINGPKISPDLAELSSDLFNPLEISIGPVAHLDIDAFYSLQDEMHEYDFGVISGKLNELRDAANAVFNEIKG